MEPEHGALVTMETGRARIRRLPIPRT